MNLVSIVRLNILWAQIRKWLWLFLLVVLFFIIYKYGSYIGLYSPLLTNILKDPVIATLIGAIIGGAIAFYGSVYVQQNQVKALTAIRRKDEIFIPLYNELLKLKDHLNKNPCPSQIVFSNQSSFPSDPVFSLWPLFKEDSRHLQIPKSLADSLDQFTDICQKYSIQWDIATDDDEVDNVIRKIIITITEKDLSKRTDLVYHYLPCNSNLSEIKKWLKIDTQIPINDGQTTVFTSIKSDNEIEEFSLNLFKECSKIECVKQLQKTRAIIDLKLEELIKSLELIIRFINEMVEGNEKWL